ncbi:MAG: signal peptidase II [Caldilineaceae bacterium]|nr:signal peptidase II [Caldilineaceae bacterium]MBP8106846.1 signal peptidase II [Caldilineaceae bacterium]MBP8121740.1 signal peptidase II [Caldilineaceae bacterium]MBP9071470.1 signal peptidase II [Caldilineaceae bacterium]
MTKTKRILLLLLVLFSTVGCDQATKSVARTYLAGENALSFLGGIFRLHYAENPGAFLSLGARLSPEAQYWIFVVVVTTILAGLLGYLVWAALRERDQLPTLVLVALSLFLGGGVGNLIDRLIFDGRVSDFMVIQVGSLSTGVFNVADMALMLALGLILLSSWPRAEQAAATGE